MGTQPAFVWGDKSHVLFRQFVAARILSSIPVWTTRPRPFLTGLWKAAWVVTGMLMASTLASVPAWTAPFGYVTTSEGVAVIDAATNTVVATIPILYGRPLGVAVTPDASRVYAAINQGVAVINAFTNTVIATIPVGNSVQRSKFPSARMERAST